MRKALILILVFGTAILFSVSMLSAVNLDKNVSYKVIKINGQILFVKSGDNMKRGDIFAPGTPLEFVTLSSRAAVMSKSNRYVLQANSKGKVKILPATSNVTSRAGALINFIDLKNHFSGRYLVFDNEKLQIGKEAFPMNDNRFFYVVFDYKGEEIAKQLSFEANFLFLKKEELFMVDGKKIPVEEKEMTLYYRNNEKKKSYKINTFTPIFPNLEELKNEVTMILDEVGMVSKEQKIAEITAYLNDFYGKPQKDNLSNWLEREFKLSVQKDINFK